MRKPLLGAHVSAAGGLYKAFDRASSMGAETIQIFGASPRQWKTKLPSEEDIQKYQDALASSSVESVYLHAAYLVNLATADRDLHKKSIENLTAHFKIANLLGAKGLIFHIGSHKGQDKDSALERVAEGMRLVLREVRGGSYLIVENSSGGGGKIGSKTEEIGELLRLVSSKRVKACLDTAHVFEAGELQFTPSAIRRYFDDWEREVGLENLVVLHANDSRTAFGSNTDRHENLGEGRIGREGLRSLTQEKRLWDKGWILEVPGFDRQGPDKKNLDILKELF